MEKDLKGVADGPSRSKVIRLSEPAPAGLSGAVCALGVFDGVHLGHRRIISDCVARARDLGAPSAVITFDRDPEEVLGRGSPRKLISNSDRIDMLSSLGADVIAVVDFDDRLAHMQPSEFISLLVSGGVPAEIIVGNDFRFGHRASGTVVDLTNGLAVHGCSVSSEDLLSVGGHPVTATRIRNLIESCSIEEANALLGRMHFIRSEVLRGRQMGRKLGFPTANLEAGEGDVGIGGGVYLGYVWVDGRWMRSCISVGVPKTFGDIPPTIEAHIVDFDDDIYGETVTACFARYLQPMEKFSGPQELSARIETYKERASRLPEVPEKPFPTANIATKGTSQ